MMNGKHHPFAALLIIASLLTPLAHNDIAAFMMPGRKAASKILIKTKTGSFHSGMRAFKKSAGNNDYDIQYNEPAILFFSDSTPGTTLTIFLPIPTREYSFSSRATFA